MASPIILVNFKSFREGTGGRADLIARAARDVAAESGVAIGVAPVATELRRISKHFEIPVYAQHVDGVSPGAYTGHITAEAVRLAGAVGTLVNHSERRLTLAEIEASVRTCAEAGLQTVVCTNNDATTGAAAALNPTYVAVEPPELIGSGISVAKADPGIIERSVAAARRVNPDVKILTGAGIHSAECVRIAVDLGTDGVLLASSVVKADEPRAVLQDLVRLL
ncbi:MAG: triose-phosphate isomerase [Methanomicrobiales archaeon]|nr:triose-phosphate isomerase [Methanomicrobiales archaeon]MDI6877559.1 triose-phosphate isomerase [Methanomicrobiales archaeon]